MTNTLTWDLKPIALPKVNSNLLSVVSLILLLTMAFMTASVIAENCDDKKKEADDALEAWGQATTRYWIAAGAAATACASAAKTKNGYVSAGCVLALGVFALAAWDLSTKTEDYLEKARAYLECLEKEKDDDDNGSGSSTTS